MKARESRGCSSTKARICLVGSSSLVGVASLRRSLVSWLIEWAPFAGEGACVSVPQSEEQADRETGVEPCPPPGFGDSVRLTLRCHRELADRFIELLRTVRCRFAKPLLLFLDRIVHVHAPSFRCGGRSPSARGFGVASRRAVVIAKRPTPRLT